MIFLILLMQIYDEYPFLTLSLDYLYVNKLLSILLRYKIKSKMRKHLFCNT